jgi:general secretion pathway protein I
MRVGSARRRGFTLIEALAAFAILALSLGQLLRSVGLGAENERRADFLAQATADGQSHLAALGLSLPLVAGETSGRYDDGLQWTLDIESDRSVSSATGGALVIGYRVRLDIRPSTMATPVLTLVGEKLATPEAGERGP